MSQIDPDHPSRTANFRAFVVRGLAVVLPPLLTIVVLIWAWNTIWAYVLQPVEAMVRYGMVFYEERSGGALDKMPAGITANEDGSFQYGYERYLPAGKKFVRAEVVTYVDERVDEFGSDAPSLTTANGYLNRYYQHKMRLYLPPVFLIVFLNLLYFLGRLFTWGLGRWMFRGFDMAILQIPVVNKVYGGVKQVTDFAFSEREIEFNNVVAVEYPRKGIWSIGFVTGNSLPQIAEATGEPMLSVLMPTSPAPMTGFTITIRKSEAIDLDMTIDEAIQFVVSCGVVLPTGRHASAGGDSSGRIKVVNQDGALLIGNSSSDTTTDPSAVQ